VSLPSQDETDALLLMSMAQTLKKRVESAEDAASMIKEYEKLRGYACSIYDDARSILPEPSALSDINDVRYAVDQLVNFATAKAFPVFLRLIGVLASLPQQPLIPLSPILSEWGLSMNWAIAASALTLMEVMVNRKCDELEISKEGSFRDRYERLNSEARKRNIELPNLLTDAFWKIRNKVIHAGEEPAYEEVKLIIDYLNFLSRSLKRL